VIDQNTSGEDPSCGNDRSADVAPGVTCRRDGHEKRRHEMEWQPVETLPDTMNRPGRCFIRVEGYQEHSGVCWARVWCDLVHTNSETGWGFRRADMDRIMRDGDMIVLERITHWMPAAFPQV
jgi:hypothetical protein